MTSTMPVTRTEAPPRFHCNEPGCELTKFSTQSNLNRHSQSKHGIAVQMPCGKSLPNHTSNTKRHQKSCRKCCPAPEQLPKSTPDEQSKFKSPTSATANATGLPSFDGTFDGYSEYLGDMYNLEERFMFESF
ncbi:hypothetical protein CORC01_09226 [Colletotrichum orchidophilum]|uniref:Uncharacterized protein n=1 Tax=Colletotrichum orchidophilum TaxID=1209926 RepID=A0A1G4B2C1_9PEZI|nr:uncharacterized protein CORC01_09226 [Colletotrichum orchidophilum]OHE95493.1 hypothetical protein CORC01_09226 [Colletotrichum orchidophilum]